jgi:hypothetical protein
MAVGILDGLKPCRSSMSRASGCRDGGATARVVDQGAAVDQAGEGVDAGGPTGVVGVGGVAVLVAVRGH